MQLALGLLARTRAAGQLVILAENEVLLVQAADLHKVEELALQMEQLIRVVVEVERLGLFLEVVVPEL